jgi:3-hydroxyisobutyrate dehydrogenase
MTNVAFIGLGNMGSGMCANLVRAGHDVCAFDLRPEAIVAAVEAGAVAAETLRAAVERAEVVITMLPAGEHVLSVYFGAEGVVAHAPEGALFLDCSTISVEDARRAATQAEDAGFLMVDAPVSGGVTGAEAGTLTFMVGGSEAGFSRARPLLDIMGTNVFHAGGAGNGQVAKIANNMLLGISMIGTCEAFNLAERLGLDAQTFFDIASTASGQCWSMTSYCPAPGPVPTAPSNRGFEAGFAVAMMLKDLNLARAAAETAEADIPLGGHAGDIYSRLEADGFAGLDFSAVMRRIRGEI